MKRVFVTSLTPTKDIDLTGQEHQHLSKVLRTTVGENVVVFCGDAFDYEYTIDRMTKTSTHLKFVQKTLNIANPTRHIAVFLALIKPDKMTAAITALNELGVAELVLFNADRCNVAPKSVNLDRMNEIARQSCKQCRRSIPMTVRITTDEPAVALRGFDAVYFADETCEPIPPLVSGELSRIAVVIGPEGGFTPNERAKLAAVATPVSLGTRILRAETAAVAMAILAGGLAQ